jgi:hypothetical protein
MSETPAFEPIRIVEIIANEIGQPRNDGTPGSALYSVPLRLSAKAPANWGALFVRNWDDTGLNRCVPSAIGRKIGSWLRQTEITIQLCGVLYRGPRIPKRGALGGVTEKPLDFWRFVIPKRAL